MVASISHDDFVAGVQSGRLWYMSNPQKSEAGGFRAWWPELDRTLLRVRLIAYPVLIGLLLWWALPMDLSRIGGNDLLSIVLGAFAAPVLIGEIATAIYRGRRVRQRLMTDPAFFELGQSKGFIEVRRKG